MRRERYDLPAMALILSAMALCYFHLYRTPWDAFAVDAPDHALYVMYIATHGGQIPHLGLGYIPASRHPPAYYALCAGLYALGRDAGMREPLLLARHVSMACFVAFLLFGVGLLRLSLPPRSAAWYSGLALLAFWPIGVTLGGRIICDLPLYMATAGVLYCLARWFKERNPADLASAFFWSGIGILVKNAGVPLALFCAGVLALALLEKGHRWRELGRLDLTAAIGFVIFCSAVTMNHDWILHYMPPKPHYDWTYWTHWFGSFSLPVFLYETDPMIARSSFWNVLLGSFLLGDRMPWTAPPFILMLFNILWLGLLLYGGLGMMWCLSRLSQPTRRIFLMLGAFAGGTFLTMAYMCVRTDNLGYADARYCYPLLALLALAHGTVMETCRAAGHKGAYRLGMELAATLVLLTGALFFTQNYA